MNCFKSPNTKSEAQYQQHIRVKPNLYPSLSTWKIRVTTPVGIAATSSCHKKVHTQTGPAPRVQPSRRARDPAGASRDGGVQTEYAPVALYQGVLRPCCQGAVAPQLGLGHRPHREVADWVGLRPADVQVIRSRFGGRSAPARYCEVLRLPQGKAQVASAEAQAGVIAPHRNAGASQAQVGGSDRAATGRRGGQMSIGGEHCV
ncbi:hypothetical protein PGT21_014465 [Puccinia graminis f. sp. tritici]|uniref:Uncharacterized protein n=1 Tax=Puccinia graminis f. sp. tritici TaxID=56615 RepID=A0A5B0MA37_PUCGR|nr:hypothetical protein PGT21_014465 [Puccinia graminis f. sp. tritici]